MTDFAESGTVIAGKFRIDKPIAIGGFSTVYRATQLDLNRPIALKLLDLEKDIDPTWLHRFEREAKLVSQLSHPNTITVFEFGRYLEKYLYIAMEYVRGRSLLRHLKKFGALNPEDVARVGSQMCRSLAEAHALGILHRDLKPSNVMLAQDGDDRPVIKVLDFGIAKVINPDVIDPMLTQAGMFIGTARYAAPEQLVHEPVGPYTDVYGVGMVLWETLVGDPAVPEIDYAACLEYHLGPSPWMLPASLNCPSGLSLIIETALQKKTSARYQSVLELAQALESWLGSEGAFAEEIGLSFTSSDVSEPSSVLEFETDSLFDDLTDGLNQHSIVGDVEVDEFDPFDLAAPPSQKMASPIDLAEPTDDEPVVEVPRKETLPQSQMQRERQRDVLPIIGIVMGLLITALVGYTVFTNESAATSTSENLDKRTVAIEAPLDRESGKKAERVLLLNALRTTKWKLQVGESVSNHDGILQTTVRARKEEFTATFTIYECDSVAHANDIFRAALKTNESIAFGTTIVRVAGNENGASQVSNTLRQFRNILNETED